MASEGSLMMTSVMYFVQEKVKVKPWSPGHNCKERSKLLQRIYNPKSTEVQMQPSITKNPSAELKIQRKMQKQIELQQIQIPVIFRIFNLTFPSPYLWADWERGLEVCSRRIAPDDLIIKSCYFQLQQLLYSFNHSSYPMFLATSINKLKIAVNS